MSAPMTPARLVVAIACLGFGIAGWVASPAAAAFPGENGKITFTSSRDGNEEIYVMNADGTGQTRLTNHPLPDFHPAWSPDGSPAANPADTTAPETKLERKPKNKLGGSKATYEFSASEPGSSFECRLDGKRFKPCSSPRKLKRLRPGKHRFEVRAIDAAGNVDPAPAKDRFEVVRGRA